MTTTFKKRLQIQMPGRAGIDRCLTFVVGRLPDDERRRVRGVVFEVADLRAAIETFADLKRMAAEAARSGEVQQFLDSLDGRARASATAGSTFAAFSKQWEETCVDGGDLKESQVESDKSILKNHLIPAFGRLNLSEINPWRVDEYKAAKRKQKHQYGAGYRPATINNHLSVLHRIMAKALENGLVASNPVRPSAWMKKEHGPEGGRRWLSFDDLAKLTAHLRGRWREAEPDRYTALMTLLTLGIRFGELRALHKEDLDLPGARLVVRRSRARKTVTTPKNGETRAHALPPGLVTDLKAWMLRTEGQLLFPGPDGGHLANNSLNRWIRQLCAEAGVEPVTAHCLRHSVASAYASLGASQKQIATLIGHRSTASTERYTHLRASDTVELAAGLEVALQRAGEVG